MSADRRIQIMTRDLTRLATERFDVLVVGGGIYGLTAAYDASLRGLSVALVDAGDFGAATSFNHLRTLHGGLRSLQTGSLRQARESLHERRVFAHIAPHLIAPLAFLMPTSRTLTRGRLAMRVGFLVDRILSWDRNHGVPQYLVLPPGRILSTEQCVTLARDVRPKEMTGGALWYDYETIDTDRLTLSFALGAVASGACLANYVTVLNAILDEQRVKRVRARDNLTGETFDIRAAVTVNAAGPWAGELMTAFGVRRPFPLQKAMNVVTTRPAADIAVCGRTRSGNLLLQVPWRGRTVVGTVHSTMPMTPLDTSVTEQDLERVHEEISTAFPWLELKREEMTLVHRGLVPADQHSDGSVSQKRTGRIVDHAGDGVEGAISVVGVKYTTARAVAQRAVDLVFRKLNRQVAPCRTATTPLPGCEMSDHDSLLAAATRTHGGLLEPDVITHLVRTYGTRYGDVADLARDTTLQQRIDPTQPVIVASVVHGVRHEMACALADVVLRRTVLGGTGYPGDTVARRCAEVIATELGWSGNRVVEEVEYLRRFYAPARVE